MRLLFTTILSLAFFGLSAQEPENFNMELLGHYEFEAELSDIWGYTDEEGNEYAIVGRFEGVSVINVTNPDSMTQVLNVPGPYSTWRDMKTWGDYAYITCESGPALLILDLSALPATNGLQYTYWISDTMTFQTAHNLYIDENGYAYIFGANYSAGGAIILDLNDDPYDPTPVGIYDQNYFHDGVVRGDTLWGGAVYLGDAQVVDVSDKANPQLVSSWKTPNAFTHNMWFDDKNDYLYTTDEVRNGSIAAYDVKDILNPTEVDEWMPKDTGIIPHNTHFMDDFLITSYYTIGINIIDVKRPDNMIEVGRYDTSPNYNYEGFHGCWGAYPYLPSGRILATDIETGLYVFEPTYVHACYLEGKVTDQHTGAPIFFPSIEIVEDTVSTEGDIAGNYTVASINPGTYSVRVNADGYFEKVVTGVVLEGGEVTVLDVELSNWPLGQEEVDRRINVAMYPNPVSDRVEVRAQGSIERIQLRDVQGRTVDVAFESTYSNAMTIDVSDLSHGVYTVQVFTEQGMIAKRLIVK